MSTMRIVGGRHRGRRLVAPSGLAVRPTADRTREALFNILATGRLATDGAPGPGLEGARVLDAFAGTGALGLEALSRGARQATFMENHANALEALKENIAALGEGERAKVLRSDVLTPPGATEPATLVFMDPPYNQGLGPPALTALAAAGWLAPRALVVVELMAKEPFEAPTGFACIEERRYGKARLVFLRAPG